MPQPQPLLSRLDDLLCRLQTEKWDPNTIPASGMRHIFAAVPRIGAAVVAHPEGWADQVSPQYLHEEIGRWLLEGPHFTVAGLGRDLLEFFNDLYHRTSIGQARRTVQQVAEEHPGEPSLAKMESLLQEMGQAFDAALHRDRARLRELGSALEAVMKHEGRPLRQGQLEQDLLNVTVLPYEIDEPDPARDTYLSHEDRTTIDISRQLELNRESEEDPPVGDAEVIAPCVRRAVWGEQGLEVEWQEARWGTDFYRWDDLAELAFTALDFEEADGVITGICTQGMIIRTATGTWFVISAAGDGYQELAQTLKVRIWGRRAEGDDEEDEEDAEPEEGLRGPAPVASPPSRPAAPRRELRTLAARLDDVVRRMHAGEWSPTLPYSYAPRISAALAHLLELVTARPQDWPAHLTGQYLHEEIGYWLMEGAGFVETALGREVLRLRNDIGYKWDIAQALRTVRKVAEEHPAEPSLRKMESLLLEMDQAFDEALRYDKARVGKLNKALYAVAHRTPRRLYQGELEEDVMSVTILGPAE